MSSQVSNENSLKSLWHLNKRDTKSSNCKVNSAVDTSNNQVGPRECKETEERCSLLSKGQSIYSILCSRTKPGLPLTVSNHKRYWAILLNSYCRVYWELAWKVLLLICLDMISLCHMMKEFLYFHSKHITSYQLSIHTQLWNYKNDHLKNNNF